MPQALELGLSRGWYGKFDFFAELWAPLKRCALCRSRSAAKRAGPSREAREAAWTRRPRRQGGTKVRLIGSARAPGFTAEKVRGAGVLEKRGGSWKIVQMHFSFAKDRVLSESPPPAAR